MLLIDQVGVRICFCLWFDRSRFCQLNITYLRLTHALSLPYFTLPYQDVIDHDLVGEARFDLRDIVKTAADKAKEFTVDLLKLNVEHDQVGRITLVSLSIITCLALPLLPCTRPVFLP
jgi:hypothetical protein